MKQNRAEPTNGLDEELDAENGEFDFSGAPRPGRNPTFEIAQGHFHGVTDEEDRARSETERRS